MNNHHVSAVFYVKVQMKLLWQNEGKQTQYLYYTRRKQFAFYPFPIHTVPSLIVVTMYNYHPRLLAKSNIEKQYFSHCVNDVCNGSPSRIRRVLLISFGMTILPKSSTRRTMPVAFIILFSFEARDARFAPVEVFAGKGELCMDAGAIFFSECTGFCSKPAYRKVVLVGESAFSRY